MIYLLDTNTCIRYINGRSLSIRAKLAHIPLVDVGVSIISKAELFYGSAKSQYPEVSRQKQVEFLTTIKDVLFDEECAKIYGTIRARLELNGTPVGGNDLLIAATAIAKNLILVTHNTHEFNRIEELRLEDWET
jgi:tRNA(fMet)-specific endonuclease VapC